MKVIQIGSELALLCIAVHYQEGTKIIVNKCGLFLKFSSVEKIYFQHGNQWRTRRGGGGGGRPPAWKIQGKLCFQGKLKFLKNPEW